MVIIVILDTFIEYRTDFEYPATLISNMYLNVFTGTNCMYRRDCES